MHSRPHILLAATALAIVVFSVEPEAKLNLAFERVGDLSPRKIEVGAEIAGLALGFLMTWSESAARTAR